VAVIILNWNGRTLLAECLPPLLAQTFTDFEVILVDNGSTDGSAAWVQTHFPCVRIIRNPTNLGFAPANNQAIRATQAEFIALLNNDTRAAPEWLQTLVQVMCADPQIGMVASKILLADNPDTVDSAGIAIDRAGIAWGLGGGEPDRPVEPAPVVEVFGASGGAAFYRRAMLDEIGLLDEDFFAYLEDVDLAWRAQWAGWRCVYAPAAVVLHHHSATSARIPELKSRLLGRNKIWLLAKNYPFPHLLLYFPVILLFELMSIGYAWRQGRLRSALAGRWAAWRLLPVMIARRRQRVQRISPDVMLDKLHPVESPLQVLRRYLHVEQEQSQQRRQKMGAAEHG
jgi:GT2 family glycosyltransferase